MEVELNIDGLDAFNKKISELKDVKKVRSRGLAAARKAMKIVQLSAKIGAAYIDDPETREDIEKNIVIRAGKSRDYGTVRSCVLVFRGGAAVKLNRPCKARCFFYQVEKQFTGVLLNSGPVKCRPFHSCARHLNKIFKKSLMNSPSRL